MKATKKKKTTKKIEEEPRKRRKYVAQPNTDEEDQSKKVSCPPKSSADTLCEKIRNGDLSDMKKVDFNKFTKEEQDRIEESIYAMMAQFKYTPLEIDGQSPKELSKIVQDK